MKPIPVTVLIDAFNYGHFIDAAIQSVLKQDDPPGDVEILVIDDGSTDDTSERVRKYGDRVQYFLKANGGQASAFNFGISQSRGDIIAFLDADDYWQTGKLQRIVKEFEKNPEVGMVYHDFYKLEPGGASVYGGFHGSSGFLPADRGSILRYDLFPTSTLAFRRSVLDRLLPIPERLAIQADGFLSACAIFLTPVVHVPEQLAIYRIHGENQWYLKDADATRLRRRMATTSALGESVRDWLLRNGFDVNRPEIRAYLSRWRISSRADEFRLSPPGRFKFFLHLLEYPRFYGVRMTWRHKLVHYFNAFGALLTGYANYHLLDDWRVRIKEILFGGRVLRDPSVGEKRG